jgi:propanol-preferring alcohol dehydrogenase
MRVPVFAGARRIEFAERPVPEPGPGQLLLRVTANALCGSERDQYELGSPVTPGHEAAGVVAAAGPGTRTTLGTPGVVFLMDFCGACRSCRVGATNQDARRRRRCCST